jgi:murein L,D-transpeptidase YcbB/YkuD
MKVGTALALVIAAACTMGLPQAEAAPGETFMPVPGAMPQPNARIISTPGSAIKPSYIAPSEERMRNTAPPPAPQPARRAIDVPMFPANTPPPARAEPAAVQSSARPEPGEPTPAIAQPAPDSPAPLVTRPEPAVRPAGPDAGERPTAVALDERAVSEKLRELIMGRQIERLIARKTDRDTVVSFYQKNRNFQPLWIGRSGPNAHARDAIAHLKGIDADGLDPADYPVPDFAVANAEAAAEAELKFTATLLTYARHAMTGRVHFSRVSPNIDYKLNFDAGDTLNRIATAGDLAKTLDGLNPPQTAYRALKVKLAEFRDNPAEAGPARIPDGPVLKLSRDQRGRDVVMSDARVPKLRVRLKLAAEPNMFYDRALANAVARFQKSHGLQPNGQLNAATIEALNPPSREKQLAAILATMERWRWIPRELGRTHVILNIPDYHLRVFNNGSQLWMTRVVVGKPTQATPLLTETMKYITVNPTWNVPQSIIYNELLPIYETSDPQIFERQGLRVERGPNGNIRVYQPPGERNALGQIRFNFPNKFLVYQHDTPERHYFAHDRRAYSHGCMRVQDPLKYAEVLMSYAAPRAGMTQARLRQMFGGNEQQLDFQFHIPVHITYQTAFVDDAGNLTFREDVYGLDKQLMGVLKAERAVADVAIERPADPNFKPTPEHHQRLNSVARGGGPNPFALFEQLFR